MSALGKRFLAIIIVLITLWMPYGITLAGAYSICLREGGLSNKKDKIKGALLLRRERISNGAHMPKMSFDAKTCCRVDSGRSSLAPNWYTFYVAGGASHAVYLQEEPSIKNSRYIAPYLVNGCGVGVQYGEIS